MSKQDILDYFSDINHAYNESTRLDTLSRMLDELVEKAASPWHSVEEPPDVDEYVHAFDGNFVGMASFDGEKWWQHDTYESFIISPSYWMPRIPDPSEDDK